MCNWALYLGGTQTRQEASLRSVVLGGKLVILNLQQTPKDRKADLVIHARCDQVMQQVMAKLGLPIPVYTRTDSALLQCSQTLDQATAQPARRRVSMTLCNAHSPAAALPLVASASISIVKVANTCLAVSLCARHRLWRMAFRLPRNKTMGVLACEPKSPVAKCLTKYVLSYLTGFNAAISVLLAAPGHDCILANSIM